MNQPCPGCRWHPAPTPGGLCDDCSRWLAVVIAATEMQLDCSRDILSPQQAAS